MARGTANGNGSNGNGAKRRNGRPAPVEYDVADAVAIAEAVLAAEARRVAEAPPVVETPRVVAAPAIIGEPALPDQPPPEPGTGKPAGRGRGFGRFRSKAVPVNAPDGEEADAPNVTVPFVDPGLMAPPVEPLPAPVPVARTAEPVVTRVVEVPTQPVPTMPAPVIIPVIPVAPDGTGELVARKVTAPPPQLDVPIEPDITGAQPLARRPPRTSVTFQRRRTRPRVRRVTRVVRHVDTWSVFKVALVFNAFLYAVMLTAGVLLWHVAIATGTIDNIERFFEGFGWESFQFRGGEIYHNAWVAGLFAAVGLTGLAVLLATLFNLITDLVGGVRVSVLEEEVLARRDRTARMVVEDDPDETLPYDQARSG